MGEVKTDDEMQEAAARGNVATGQEDYRTTTVIGWTGNKIQSEQTGVGNEWKTMAGAEKEKRDERMTGKWLHDDDDSSNRIRLARKSSRVNQQPVEINNNDHRQQLADTATQHVSMTLAVQRVTSKKRMNVSPMNYTEDGPRGSSSRRPHTLLCLHPRLFERKTCANTSQCPAPSQLPTLAFLPAGRLPRGIEGNLVNGKDERTNQPRA
ncbi:hypothetical protein FISHEDRAFT_60028 [Fistulina hepatica ATCC 64428]|uniref:Uncharacterized protein n=1 Tax=Fistulina hepatica ATCC 64428 TaxID=1128425 RepID=A0A0D7A915_9AGAR|nr:hypothetical protein FISHEDRAFT_60028 [Fistulina hepatica ATCC 64428]